MIPLGKIVAGHGVRGLARVKPFNPGSTALEERRDVWLALPGDAERRAVHVIECRPHRGLFLLRFEGIESLDDLEPWIGGALEIEAAALPELAADELYHHEAIGIEVQTLDGSAIGRIVEVMALPANDVWVVRGAGRSPGEAEHEWLIPAVAPIVQRIDLRGGVAVIDPIPGLLEGF